MDCKKNRLSVNGWFQFLEGSDVKIDRTHVIFDCFSVQTVNFQLFNVDAILAEDVHVEKYPLQPWPPLIVTMIN